MKILLIVLVLFVLFCFASVVIVFSSVRYSVWECVFDMVFGLWVGVEEWELFLLVLLYVATVKIRLISVTRICMVVCFFLMVASVYRWVF